MKKASSIYIAGHTGLIGRVLVRELSGQGYRNLLVRTHRELDLTDRKETELFFKKERPEYVFLMAAKTGGINANIASPASFIYENTIIAANVIELAYRYQVKKMLFLGCGCMYPRICRQPIKEEYFLSGPLEPTNEPYALAKILGLKMCQAYNRQYGTNFITAIAANVYGPGDHFDDSGHVVASLIKRFYEAKIDKKKEVIIWGTGKPRRDFIYVDDVSQACLFLMNHYQSSEFINIGSGQATAIAELAGLIKEFSGFKGKIIYDRSKPDGMPERLLDITKIKALRWKPQAALREGIKTTLLLSPLPGKI